MSCCLLAFAATLSPAYANPAPLGSPGTSLLPLDLKRFVGISIAEETLTIKDGMKDLIPSFAPGGKPMEIPAVKYEATYRFRNKTGRTQKVKAGFPVITYMHKAGDNHGGLSLFDITFGDNKIPCKEISRSKQSIYAKRDLSGISDELLSAGLVRTIAATPDFIDIGKLANSREECARILRASRKLTKPKVAQITRALDNAVFGEGDEVVQGQCLVWYAFDLQLPNGLSKPLKVSYTSMMPVDGEYSINYLLRTAKYWGDAIGRLIIVFEPDKIFLQSGGKYKLYPAKDFVHFQERYVLKRSMTVPDFDIQIKRKKGSAARMGPSAHQILNQRSQ